MGLQTYRAKRNFRVTPEPRGKVARGSRHELAFVVQKHEARHLHYDFRLESNGVLLSWAIPKGPSLDPADKRLAMRVEDHPIDYGDFEGVIPEKQYGGGTVMLWDRGTWRPREDPVAGYAKGHLKFELDGENLKGGWTLVRTRGSKYGGKSGDQAWLLIKENDRYARPGSPSIVEKVANSVTTGRSMAEIAAARSNVWQSNLSVKENINAGAIAPVKKARAKSDGKPARTKANGGRRNLAAKDVPGAKAARMPAMLTPMLTTLVKSAPTGDEWLHEIKYDGYRMLCRIKKGKARLVSRNGKDWTAAFGTVAADLAELPVREAWIDGEVVVLDKAGRTSFQALQNALTAEGAPLSFFAFDILYLDGYDLRGATLTDRKSVLRELVGDGVGAIRVGPELLGHGDKFFQQACKLGLEGVISKRADSLYRDGLRTRDWIKVKCTRRQEMVIGGFTDPQGSRKGFGALLLGVYADGKLHYSGKVGTGFNDESLKKLYEQLHPREQDKPAFVNPPRGFEAKGAHWVKPDLVAEIAFTEWSDDGALRHPSFQGLRADKKATDVVREEPQATFSEEAPQSRPRTTAVKGRSAKTTEPAAKTGRAAVTVAGIPISNPDKPYFPEAGITKIDVVRYFERIAPWIVPHIERRPLSLVRCPDGWTKQCFYQKHADKSVNPAVDRIEVPEGNGTATYMGAHNAAGLVGLVQWGVLEMHPWGSRKPRLDRPDQLIFDLDPDEGLEWKGLVTGVELLRTLLDELELEGFLKTTGGKGLHVVLPIRTTLDWAQAKGFTKAVADFMVATFPDRFTATIAKAKRTGKTLIDYLRNAEGATAIAPYAVRARANAPVSMPIPWDELKAADVRFAHFNLRNAEERLSKQKRDPWRDFLAIKQTITKAHAKRVGFAL
jgi:bifunctional non-homologous end joining protein LigD